MSDKFDLQPPSGEEDDLDTATTNDDSIEIEIVSDTAWVMEQLDNGPVSFEVYIQETV